MIYCMENIRPTIRYGKPEIKQSVRVSRTGRGVEEVEAQNSGDLRITKEYLSKPAHDRDHDYAVRDAANQQDWD